MPGDPDSPRAAGEAHQAPRLAPVAQPQRPIITRLRDRLIEVDYDVDRVIEVLGASAHAALARNHTMPGLRALAGCDDPLATLTRLWPLQASVTARAAETALPGLVEPLSRAGFLERRGEEVRALVDLRPYGSDDGASGWIVSDLTPSMDGQVDRVADDYVLGVSPASTTLIQMATRTKVESALDLGTGCGVQSLHLARHATRIVATDVNHRALHLAGWTLALNGLGPLMRQKAGRAQVELRHGSLYEPVAGETFDQVISNPPYVMAPPSSAHLTYREQGLPGDQLVREVVTGAARLLNPAGTAQFLANWAHPNDGDWAERLTTWVAGTECDLHVVQREVLDPSEYVELWLADARLIGTPGYRRAYDGWLDHFAAIGVSAVGMGWVFLHRSGRATPELTVEHWPHPVAQPVGADVAAWPARSRAAHLPSAQLLDSRPVIAPDVVTESVGRPGEADPQQVALRQRAGLCRIVPTGTALAGVVGACDGELPLGVIIAAVAHLLEVDAEALTEELLPDIRMLVRHGMITGVTV